MDYCRRQGWLSFDPLPNPTPSSASPVSLAFPGAAPTPDPHTTSESELSAAAKDAPRQPRPAAKPNPRDNTSRPRAVERTPQTASQHKSPPSSEASKQRRAELPIPDTAQVVPDTTYQAGPDIPAERTDSPEVAIPEALNAARAGLRTGGGDWLRALDSDAEGDEELILQDGNDDESVDDIASVASDESGDYLANEDDDVPVDFDLTNEDLDNLRAGGWDVYMEQQSCQVLREGSSLYDGPSGPTRAALAYAENPLAIF
ncbi:hypothetical protein DVH05_002798 [Phytophthora capsici]|nr:hypothetical protein DVH05_002798 [Phytophthora capsici]